MSATKEQIHAAFRVLRKAINDTGWGGWVSDSSLMPEAEAVAEAVVAASPRPIPAPVQPPAPQAQKGE